MAKSAKIILFSIIFSLPIIYFGNVSYSYNLNPDKLSEKATQGKGRTDESDDADALDKREAAHNSTLVLEYDDNVNLSDGTTESKQEDFFIHYTPFFLFQDKDERREFTLDLNGDYRRGFNTNISEFNVSASGNVDVHFPGNLNLNIEDTYKNSAFDGRLYDNSDFSGVQNNFAGIKASYAYVERLRVEAGYSYEWEKTEGYRTSIKTAKGRLQVPVTRRTVSYVAVSDIVRESDEISPWNYDDLAYQIGVEWTGPVRFSFFIEAGREDIDYRDSEIRDLNEGIYRGGLRVNVSEATKVEASVGKDVHGTTTFLGKLVHSYGDDFLTNIDIGKETVIPYYSQSSEDASETVFVKFRQKAHLFDRLDASIGGHYQNMRSDTVKSGSRRDDAWLFRLDLSYITPKKLEIGGYYQFATRKSNVGYHEYENTRVGAVFSIGF